MMSLFSSFDFYLFYLSFFFCFLMAGMIFPAKMFFLGSKQGIFSFFQCFMKNFFDSLNFSNYSKGISFLSSSIMLMIFIFNLLSIFPFVFPVTSQVSFVLTLSLAYWSTIMIFYVYNNYKMFLSHLVPEGSPVGLSFVLLVIELVSSVIRPITLTVRLVANILAGHLLIILLSILIQNFNLAFPGLIFLNLVEIFVSLIQSYILVTLLSLYYSEL